MIQKYEQRIDMFKSNTAELMSSTENSRKSVEEVKKIRLDLESLRKELEIEELQESERAPFLEKVHSFSPVDECNSG
jgi:replicative DNA helicase